jgi:hypothetical protein
VLSPEHGAAWFLGEKKPIRYCLEVAKDYGVRPEVLQPMVDESFKIWWHYLEAKRVLEERTRIPRLSTRAEKLPSCHGEKPDLIFYFGVTNDEIDHYRSGYDHPRAFAQRTGLRQGLIWLARQNELRQLEALLLHEIGHALGNGHVTGTIMDAELPMLIAQPGFPTKRIDTYRELYLCMTCGSQYTGVFPAEDEVARQIFHRFVGRDPQGKEYRITLTRGLNQYWNKVSFTDAGAPLDIRIDMRQWSSPEYQAFTVEANGPVFKVFRAGMEAPYYSPEYNAVTNLTLPTGKEGKAWVQILDNYLQNDSDVLRFRKTWPEYSDGTGNRILLSVWLDGELITLGRLYGTPL